MAELKGRDCQEAKLSDRESPGLGSCNQCSDQKDIPGTPRHNQDHSWRLWRRAGPPCFCAATESRMAQTCLNGCRKQKNNFAIHEVIGHLNFSVPRCSATCTLSLQGPQAYTVHCLGLHGKRSQHPASDCARAQVTSCGLDQQGGLMRHISSGPTCTTDAAVF